MARIRGDLTRGTLTRYRIMAYTVGTGLVVLVFIGMPIQFWAHSKSVVEVVGPVHGIAYIVYLAAALDLWRRSRWNLVQLLALVGAGFVPFLAFVVERHLSRLAEASLCPTT